MIVSNLSNLFGKSSLEKTIMVVSNLSNLFGDRGLGFESVQLGQLFQEKQDCLKKLVSNLDNLFLNLYYIERYSTIGGGIGGQKVRHLRRTPGGVI